MKPYLDSWQRRYLRLSRLRNAKRAPSFVEWYEFTKELRNLGAEVRKERASFYVLNIAIIIFCLGMILGEYLGEYL